MLTVLPVLSSQTVTEENEAGEKMESNISVPQEILKLLNCEVNKPRARKHFLLWLNLVNSKVPRSEIPNLLGEMTQSAVFSSFVMYQCYP